MVRSVTTGALLLLVLAGGVTAQLRVVGDAKVWEEVLAAYERLGKLKTYRMRLTAPGQSGTVTIEVVNPDRRRSSQPVGNATLEIITVGSETRFRLTGPRLSGTWQCRSAFPQAPPSPPADPADLQGTVTVSRLTEAAVDGTAAVGYQYALTVQSRSTTHRLYLLADRLLPRRLETLDATGRVAGTVDYLDYDATITIELPKCP